jgi:hypothetical protein
MGTQTTHYKKGPDGKIRRSPSPPERAEKPGSPEEKSGDVKNNTPGNPATKGA